MAVEFPPNLDDGENWLPSQIFSEVGVLPRQHPTSTAAAPLAAAPPPKLPPSYTPSDLDCLARHLAAFRLLDRTLNPSYCVEPLTAGGSAVVLVAPPWSGGRFAGRAGTARVWKWHPVRFAPPVRARESGGTGVFIPRVGLRDGVLKSSSSTEYMKREEVRKQPPAGVFPKHWSH